ncbi:MAG: hypothetical protein J0H08_07590, partial [Rhizobiales bacterium]|nr:hypothetical protein [Hyphomicrobiales bacterium]
MNRRSLLTLAAMAGATAFVGAVGPERLAPIGAAQAAAPEGLMEAGPLGEMTLGDPNA